MAVAGITAYDAFGRPKATMGRQDETLGGVELWVVPNPSGLNAHETVDSLAEAYRAPALAAGHGRSPARWPRTGMLPGNLRAATAVPPAEGRVRMTS